MNAEKKIQEETKKQSVIEKSVIDTYINTEEVKKLAERTLKFTSETAGKSIDMFKTFKHRLILTYKSTKK